MSDEAPERRVGEAVAKLSREMVAQVARMNRENYVGELAADWLALTAEVERLTNALKQAESDRTYHEADAALIREEHDNVVRAALSLDGDTPASEWPSLAAMEPLREACAKYRAALSLPTPAPAPCPDCDTGYNVNGWKCETCDGTRVRPTPAPEATE